MAFLTDASFTNIELINTDTNLFHTTGTGTFWVDSKDGIIRIGHTGATIYLDGNITIEGNLYGATGYTGPTGQTGHTGAASITTGPTGQIGNIGTPATLGYLNSNVQNIINNSNVAECTGIESIVQKHN